MSDLTLVGCWAHVRRGFHEALAETKLAAWFVGQIGQLYAVEKKLREQKAGPALRAGDASLAIATGIDSAASGHGVDTEKDLAARFARTGD